MRLGIYGGTFSPIHLGHLRAAEAFLETMKLDRLLIIPTAISPHKDSSEGASASDRLEMARLAFRGCDPRIGVSDFEVRREEKSYTIYTIEHFAKPENELFMLVGTDMFLTLSKWFRASDIFKLASIVLMRRESDDELTAQIKAKKTEYESQFMARIHIIDKAPIVLSSTEIRGKLKSDNAAELITPEVLDYIRTNKLYGN